MRRLLFVLLVISLTVCGLTACKPGLLPTAEGGKPKVSLDRVEVMSYFPWADLPARTPLALGFLFNIENPSGYKIMLDNIKFTVSFEAAPGMYIESPPPPITIGFISHLTQQASIES